MINGQQSQHHLSLKTVSFFCLIQLWYRLDNQTVNACASCVGGREFKSHRLAKSYGSPPLQHLRSSYVALALWRGDGHRKLVTLFGV